MGRRRKPPAAVGQGERPQQPAIAIDDDRRAVARGHQIDRSEARDVARPRDRRAEAATRASATAAASPMRTGRVRRKAVMTRPFSRCGRRCRQRRRMRGPRREALETRGDCRRQPLIRPRFQRATFSRKGRRGAERRRFSSGDRLTSPSPPARRTPCGRSAPDRTCPRRSPADRRSGRARPRGPHRRG